MYKKTEDLLYLLFWSCATVLRRPSPYQALYGRFEGWTYGKGLSRQVSKLERRQLVEAEPGSADRGAPNLTRAYRLTEAGRLHALGGRDPEEAWAQGWDGLWRLVSFDVPQNEVSLRNRLRKRLRRLGLGHLQHSVWVSPHRIEGLPDVLPGAPVDARSLVVLETRPCAGETDQDIVAAA